VNHTIHAVGEWRRQPALTRKADVLDIVYNSYSQNDNVIIAACKYDHWTWFSALFCSEHKWTKNDRILTEKFCNWNLRSKVRTQLRWCGNFYYSRLQNFFTIKTMQKLFLKSVKISLKSSIKCHMDMDCVVWLWQLRHCDRVIIWRRLAAWTTTQYELTADGVMSLTLIWQT